MNRVPLGEQSRNSAEDVLKSTGATFCKMRHREASKQPLVIARQEWTLDRVQELRSQLIADRHRLYREELADWMGGIVGTKLTADTLLASLADGVILVRLAQLISRSEAPFKIHPNAKRGNYQARDHVAQFLSWVPSVGVHNVLLFEVDDLVNKDVQREKQVLHTLLEMSRCQGTYAPPMIVTLERQMHRGAGAVASAEDEGSVSVEMVVAVAQGCGFDTTLCTQRDAAGRFFFGQEEPVHVRQVRERLLVRYDGQWTPLETYLGLLSVNNGGDLLAMLGEQDSSKSGASSTGSAVGTPGGKGALGGPLSTGKAGNFWGVKLGRGRGSKQQRGSQSDSGTGAGGADGADGADGSGAGAAGAGDAFSENVQPIQASTPTRKRSRASLQLEQSSILEGAGDGEGKSTDGIVGMATDTSLSSADVLGDGQGVRKGSGANLGGAGSAVGVDTDADGSSAAGRKRIFVRKTYTFTEVVEVVAGGQPARVTAMGAHERCDVFHNEQGPVGEPRATLIARLGMDSPQLAALAALLSGFKEAQSSAVVAKLSESGIQGLLADNTPYGEVPTSGTPAAAGEALFPVAVAQPSPLLSQWMK